jgi:hypothetical protein
MKEGRNYTSQRKKSEYRPSFAMFPILFLKNHIKSTVKYTVKNIIILEAEAHFICTWN